MTANNTLERTVGRVWPRHGHLGSGQSSPHIQHAKGKRS
jgi:hypothetical protein